MNDNLTTGWDENGPEHPFPSPFLSLVSSYHRRRQSELNVVEWSKILTPMAI